MPQLQPFHEWLPTHAHGTLDDEITAALAEVTQAVIDLDKKGKVLIEIEVDTAGTGRRTVMVGGKVTAKPPTPDPERSIFYPDAGGGLHRDDPYQTRAFDPTTGEPTA